MDQFRLQQPQQTPQPQPPQQQQQQPQQQPQQPSAALGRKRQPQGAPQPQPNQQKQEILLPPTTLGVTRAGVHPNGKPKRPPNAFLVFSSVRRRELQTMYPHLKTADLSKFLGDEWRDMDPTKKMGYTLRAKGIKDDFQVTNPDYVYTRRTSKKRSYEDSGSGSKRFKGSDENGGEYGSIGLDPNRPRRPMNSYLIFNQEMRHKLLLGNANLTVTEISRAIGHQWATMPPDQKRYYAEKAEGIKTQFMREHPDYVYSRRSKAEIAASGGRRRVGSTSSSHVMAPSNTNTNGASKTKAKTSETKKGDKTLTKGANQLVVNKGVVVPVKMRTKKKAKDPDAPKHPIPGFLFFRSEERERIRQENPDKAIPALAAKMWNEMTPAQKEPWQKMAAKDKRRYAEEMQAYSAKKGRQHKVR
ncbi:hypothetical protein BG005_001280 [Podila minutissima]|nr:hypothetical protein BG005_001280 [Podila minutissima]